MNDSSERLPPLESLEVGIYRHFKGGEYRVFGVKHADGTVWVEYEAVETREFHRRELEEFLGTVDKPEFNYRGPRFWKAD